MKSRSQISRTKCPKHLVNGFGTADPAPYCAPIPRGINQCGVARPDTFKPKETMNTKTKKPSYMIISRKIFIQTPDQRDLAVLLSARLKWYVLSCVMVLREENRTGGEVEFDMVRNIRYAGAERAKGRERLFMS